MSNRYQQAARAASFVALLMGSALVHAAALPPVHKIGQVEYLSGGIGKDESTAIQAAARKWPLTLEFAEKDGQHADYLADVKVIVRDAAGHSALQAQAEGPFLLARLAPGRYNVEATLAGKTLHEPVVVKRGQPGQVAFVWPAGIDKTNS
ncbi:MAG: hypothetical protein ABI409_05330 [Ramlibacter sp.]